jgi:hypothetical protein
LLDLAWTEWSEGSLYTPELWQKPVRPCFLHLHVGWGTLTYQGMELWLWIKKLLKTQHPESQLPAEALLRVQGQQSPVFNGIQILP